MNFRKITAPLTLMAASLCFNSYAGLIMTIDEISNDTLTVSVNGSLDTMSSSNSGNPGYLAFKADWSRNLDSNVNWWNGSFNRFDETFTDGDIFSSSGLLNNTSDGDAVIFRTIDGGLIPIPDDEPFNGTFTLSGNNIFDWNNVSSLQVMSGWNRTPGDWNRFEASVNVQSLLVNNSAPRSVPEPSSLAIFSLSLLGLGLRKYKNTSKGLL